MAGKPPPVETGPGFYPQPNEYTCGPFALKHAMIALGMQAEAQQIAATAKTHWWTGTDEIRLARAAREFSCDLILERRSDAEDARKILIKFLRDGIPVLLCVEEWTHWITVVSVEDRRFVVIDSVDEPVMGVLTWPQLRAKWKYSDVDYDKVTPPVLYDLMAVMPRSRTSVKADFSVERIKHLRRPENQQLALHWNEYLEDLLSICRPASARLAEALSMAEFLRRHQELLVSRVVFWHGAVVRDDILKVLRHFRFVSETYGLVVPAAASRRAVADLAMLLSMWACASRGIEAMYGAPGAIARAPAKSSRPSRPVKPTKPARKKPKPKLRSVR